MADCEKNILTDFTLFTGQIPSDWVVLVTAPDGTSYITTGATVLGTAMPNDIEYKVGVTSGAPVDGDLNYTNGLLIGRRIRVFRTGMKQGLIDPGTGNYYLFNQSTGTVGFTPTQKQDEVIQIEIY